jgi:hypothetical protein
MPTGYDAAISYDASTSYDGTAAGFASYGVLVDWNNDGDFSDANENITTDVLSFATVQGRSLASQVTGKAIAGMCEILLKNNTGKYSSFNTASALSGSILPNRRVKIESQTPTNETIFLGYLENIIPSVDSQGVTTAKLVALGSIKRFATTKVSVPMTTSSTTGVVVGAILDAVGWAAGDRTIATGNTTLSRYYADNINSLQALREVESTEAGFIREGKDGKIIFENRQHRYTATRSKTSQATFTDAAGSDLSYNGIIQHDPLDLIFNRFIGSVKTEAVGSVATLWTHPVANTSGDAPKIKIGESVTIIAEYPNEITGNDQTSVNAWTTPAATTDYLTNTAQNGTGSNTTSSMTVAVSKASKTMEIKITNGHTADVYLTKLQARGTPVTASNTVKVLSEDSTSQTSYGLKEFPAGGEAKWIPNQEEANDWARYHLAAYKDPTATLTLTVNANQSTAVIKKMLELDVSDRITVTASNLVKLGISRDFFIETIRHTVVAGGKHDLSFELSDTSGYAGFWVVGVSKLGQETRLAY